MSANLEPRRLFQIVLCLAAIVPVGCATRGYERASATSFRIDVLTTELTAAKLKLDTSVGALDKVISTEDDSFEPYMNFVHALAQMEGQADTIHAQAEALRSVGASYFDEWEATLASFTSEDMRKLSEARRADLMLAYDEITAVSQKTKEAYEPLMSDLNDIKQYLGLDLSAASVSGIGEQVTKVKGEAAKVQESIDALVQALDQLSSKLAGGAAPNSSEEPRTSDEPDSSTDSSDESSASETDSSETTPASDAAVEGDAAEKN